MVKKRLMLGAAFAALSLVPLTNTPAAAQDLLDNYDLDVYADWNNDVDVELDWDVDVSKELNIYGFISIDGSVTADALSQATLDDKQFLSENDVNFEDYQNAYQNEPSQNLNNEPGVGQGEGDPAFTEEGAASGPAIYSNSIVSSSVASSTSGNVGINLAAGDYNLQENAAVLSSADGSFPAETQTSASSYSHNGAGSATLDASGSGSFYVDGIGISASGSITLDLAYNFTATGSTESSSSRSARTSGAAEAGNFSLQSLYNNGFNEDTYELENTSVTNDVTVSGALSTSDGNLEIGRAHV